MTQALFFTSTQPNGVPAPWVPGETFTISAYYEFAAGTAFGSGDTITWTNAITPSGITAIATRVVTTQLDANASPTLVYEFGDNVTGDTNGPSRYIALGKTGTNVAGAIVGTDSNVTPTFSTGVQTKGIGFTYATDENSVSSESNGYNDLVVTFTSANATGATTGCVWVYFTYYCGGGA